MLDQVNGMPLVKHESGATWPVDTDLVYAEGSTKLKLTIQHALVRMILQDAIDHIRSKILFTHAFLDASLSITFARDALISAVLDRLPTSQNVHAQLISDDDYIGKLITPVHV